jgi:hypothetical protein
MAATARPWRIEPYVDAIHIHGADGSMVADIADKPVSDEATPPDNARLIVRAVNLHDELVAACEMLDAACVGDPVEPVMCEALAMARAALARAKEQP